MSVLNLTFDLVILFPIMKMVNSLDKRIYCLAFDLVILFLITKMAKNLDKRMNFLALESVKLVLIKMVKNLGKTIQTYYLTFCVALL